MKAGFLRGFIELAGFVTVSFIFSPCSCAVSVSGESGGVERAGVGRERRGDGAMACTLMSL